ncbi:hypothetical protein BKA83DRAFT_4124242 [Pisolithus microcarpus]|nr:hypothetical protein BKA83DRAFT_4124242 [Pisolithus microcarpus]
MGCCSRSSDADAKVEDAPAKGNEFVYRIECYGLILSSDIFSEAPRRSFLDLPAKSATTTAGGKSPSLASELTSTGIQQPRAESSRHLKIEYFLTCRTLFLPTGSAIVPRFCDSSLVEFVRRVKPQNGISVIYSLLPRILVHVKWLERMGMARRVAASMQLVLVETVDTAVGRKEECGMHRLARPVRIPDSGDHRANHTHAPVPLHPPPFHNIGHDAIKRTMISELNLVVAVIVQTTLTGQGDCGFETHSLSGGESCDEGYVNGWLARPQTVLQLTGGAEEMKTMKVLGRGGEPAKEPESRTETPGSKSKYVPTEHPPRDSNGREKNYSDIR